MSAENFASTLIAEGRAGLKSYSSCVGTSRVKLQLQMTSKCRITPTNVFYPSRSSSVDLNW